MESRNLINVMLRGQNITAANSTYKKLAVQCLNEALCPENRD